MNSEDLDKLATFCRDGLLNDTLPFWMDHCVDREYGGFMTALDRDGSLLDTDKSMWQQGRFTWLLATLYNTVEHRPEWLELAKSGVEFIRRYGFDDDGRMFFIVTRDGRPLRKRRYVFTEAFAAIGLAAYARAANDEEAAQQARHIFDSFIRYATTPGLLEPKGVPTTRPSKSIALPMITINVAQVLRETIGESTGRGNASLDELIDRSIAEIGNDFAKPDLEAVMETVGPNGEIISE